MFVLEQQGQDLGYSTVFFSGILGHVLVRENFTIGGSPPATPQLIEGLGEGVVL